MAIDVECYEHPPRSLTELGVAILDTRHIKGAEPGFMGQDLFDFFYFYHFRMKENAHMINRTWVSSAPENFDFGKTRWLNQDQAKPFLADCFQTRVSEDSDEFVPVLFLGHAMHGDEDLLRTHFGVNVDDYGSIIAKVDTQKMARELRLHRQLIGLRDLTTRFGIEPRHLHNAGNDIAYTMMDAIFLAFYKLMTRHVKYRNPYAHVDLTIFGIQQKIDTVMANSSVSTYNTYGSEHFCLRCERSNHSTRDCYAKIWCDRCKAAGKPVNMYKSHKTARCLRRDVPDLPEGSDYPELPQ